MSFDNINIYIITLFNTFLFMDRFNFFKEKKDESRRERHFLNFVYLIMSMKILIY